MYIITHCMDTVYECATETLATILRKFSYVNELNVMLPRKKRIYCGWPFPLETQDYRPSSKPFNSLIEHAIAQIKSNDPITTYFHNLDKFEQIYQSDEAATHRYCIPNGFSITKNLLSHCLGMQTGFPTGRPDITQNAAAVKQYIQFLDKEFTLVMIMEYFFESLVLLKRLMCWSLRDMLYKHVNVGNYTYKRIPPKGDNHNRHKQWSSADYLLYDHFNRTFWQKIKAEGNDFFEEVNQFRKIQLKFSTFCNYIKENSLKDKVLNIEASEYNENFQVTYKDCEFLDKNLLDLLKAQYDNRTYVKDNSPDKGLMN
ncbi:hypothetical protein KUTeg_013770 [Tegillarca granosa]|uniref:Uncharacterized protein n=1 Tax=Tegillarca granosa TaxID=220873 RepID=A0ABQ9EX45_TEGGR|nr:hypothetical protein KUTeg_013770 [Tegillarca granosa]